MSPFLAVAGPAGTLEPGPLPTARQLHERPLQTQHRPPDQRQSTIGYARNPWKDRLSNPHLGSRGPGRGPDGKSADNQPHLFSGPRFLFHRVPASPGRDASPALPGGASGGGRGRIPRHGDHPAADLPLSAGGGIPVPLRRQMASGDPQRSALVRLGQRLRQRGPFLLRVVPLAGSPRRLHLSRRRAQRSLSFLTLSENDGAPDRNPGPPRRQGAQPLDPGPRLRDVRPAGPRQALFPGDQPGGSPSAPGGPRALVPPLRSRGHPRTGELESGPGRTRIPGGKLLPPFEKRVGGRLLGLAQVDCGLLGLRHLHRRALSASSSSAWKNAICWTTRCW